MLLDRTLRCIYLFLILCGMWIVIFGIYTLFPKKIDVFDTKVSFLILGIGLFIIFICHYAIKALQRKREWIILTFGMLSLILFLCMFFFLICLLLLANEDLVIYYHGKHVNDPYENTQFLWNHLVRTHPEKLCKIEIYFQCSGFNNTCSLKKINCPTNCEDGNQFMNSCYPLMKEYLNQQIKMIRIISIAALIIVFFIFILHYKVYKQIRITKNQSYHVLEMNQNNNSDI